MCLYTYIIFSPLIEVSIAFVRFYVVCNPKMIKHCFLKCFAWVTNKNNSKQQKQH